MLRYFLSIIFFCLLSLSCLADGNEKGKYSIEVAGINIGNLYTSKVSKGDLTFYYFESKVSVWLFMQITVTHEMACVYNKNVLQTIDIHSFVNNEKYYSRIEWQNDHYNVDIKTYKYTNDKPLKDEIHFSVVKLFFEEPSEQKTILADNYGVMAPVTVLKPNVYQVKVLDKKNKYTYKDGALVKAEMEGVIKNFIIRKVK